MGAVLRDMGQLEGAETLGAEAVRRVTKLRGPRHWHVAAMNHQLGRTLLALKRYSEAASAFERAYSIFLEVFGPDDWRTADLPPVLVTCYERWNDAEPGAGHDEKAAEWQTRVGSEETRPEDEPR